MPRHMAAVVCLALGRAFAIPLATKKNVAAQRSRYARSHQRTSALRDTAPSKHSEPGEIEEHAETEQILPEATQGHPLEGFPEHTAPDRTTSPRRKGSDPPLARSPTQPAWLTSLGRNDRADRCEGDHGQERGYLGPGTSATSMSP